tara:strand:- start:243 stop:497 length:255 start_codon:yes stop_codon:yes gene_type:complete
MNEIVSGIEIPRPPFKIKWHFGDFEVGDSKAIPFENNQQEVTRFRVAASAYGKRNGRVYVSRTTYEDGNGEAGDIKMLRVWRTV